MPFAAEYGEKEYWEQRYAKEDANHLFDWYMPYECFSSTLRTYLKKKATRVLYLGCGLSEVPEKLHGDGFTNVTAVDFVPRIVAQMAQRNREREGLMFQLADISDTHTTLPEADVIVDKGMLDSVICVKHSAEHTKQARENIYAALAPGGVYLCVSHSGPDARLHALKDPACPWDVTVTTIKAVALAEYLRGGRLDRIDSPYNPNLVGVGSFQEDCYYLYHCRKPLEPAAPG